MRIKKKKDDKRKYKRETTTEGTGAEQTLGEHVFAYFVVGVVLFCSVFKGERNGDEMKTELSASPRGKSCMSIL